MIIVICGFGRCGSSLAMQMLAAGGMPVVGDWPDYESPSAMRLTRELAEVYAGRAMKLLDPHVYPLPRGPRYRAVWLDRDPRQQALSQIKFLRGMAGVKFRAGALKRMIRGFREDRPKALAGLRESGVEMLATLSFEDLLADPLAAAVDLAAAAGQVLDVSAMADCVLPRDPTCRPDLGIEAMLLRGCKPPRGYCRDMRVRRHG